MSRRLAYSALTIICAAPRLGILLHERGAVTASFTEKSDTIARMFVDHGTFGFVPGAPTAYTQPLYAWFLIPIYWLFGANWWAVGTAQILVAIATAWLVFEIGRRLLGARAGVVAAAIATLNPYLVWHDVHVNREIVDQLVAAALVLLTLVVVDRPRTRSAVLLGVVSGLAMLGNSRLVFLPILCAAYIAWRLPRARSTAVVAALVLGGAAVAVAPWLVRNKASVGCWALTTDGRAMWKANNPRTYDLLSSGQWIDNIGPNPPRPPGRGRLTPEEANGIWLQTHGSRTPRPDECAQMRFYQHLALVYWRDHPGGKAKLMALSAKLLWQPNALETADRNGAGGHLDLGRRVIEPVYMWALYVLAAVGLFVARGGFGGMVLVAGVRWAPRCKDAGSLDSRCYRGDRGRGSADAQRGPAAQPLFRQTLLGPFVGLALLLLAYQTVAALVFVGATRYRVTWDFLLALLAAAALTRIVQRARAR